MAKTIQQVLEMADGIELVDIRFVDLPGTWQHFTMPAHRLTPDFFEEGIPFDGSSICSISEMGLVADNATLLCKQLMNDYNLNYFSKQASQEDFIALGDDNGLFIIVSEKRKWYPTGQLSGQYDSTIKFSHAGRVHVLEMKGS